MSGAATYGVVPEHPTSVERLDPVGVDRHLAELADVLRSCVEGGASVGFLTPFTPAEAHRYWQDVRDLLGAGGRVLLVARRDGRVVGTAQLVLATPANGAHRAEVCKVLVHPDARRGGVGRALMDAIDTEARRHGRSLLLLDTVRGSAGERLYRAVGYQVSGVIPGYARSTEGTLEDTTVMFKALSPTPVPG
ncbi:GNAT family N-acetyltransferase [Micromonospora sp. NPDC050417]|uniref:GNAT family N-acetyltransferase n=1 Tax=Micromonospora sp. NPDC050417 TaxID=3364280 RepID=UPI0037BABDC9